MVVSTSKAPKEAVVNITRPHDDVQNKMAEEERKNLKIGVKIFINEDSTNALTECLEKGTFLSGENYSTFAISRI